jgi:hypothetical protein
MAEQFLMVMCAIMYYPLISPRLFYFKRYLTCQLIVAGLGIMNLTIYCAEQQTSSEGLLLVLNQPTTHSKYVGRGRQHGNP